MTVGLQMPHLLMSYFLPGHRFERQNHSGDQNGEGRKPSISQFSCGRDLCDRARALLWRDLDKAEQGAGPAWPPRAPAPRESFKHRSPVSSTSSSTVPASSAGTLYRQGAKCQRGDVICLSLCFISIKARSKIQTS